MTSTQRRTAALACTVVTLALAGCSSGSSDAAEPTAAATAGATQPAGPTGDGSTGGGGISGLIAALQDGVMQIQESDSQTSVTWTDETTFTRAVTIATADVAVGSCVLAVLPAAADDGTVSAATSIVVSEAVDGECSAGFGGRAGGGAGVADASGGLPTDMPTGMPTDMPTDMPGGGAGGLPTDMPTDMPTDLPGGGMVGGFGQMIGGTVTAVADGALTVEVTGTDGATTTETVTADAATAITTTAPADASAVAVGMCASVRGEADNRGGMTATSVELSDSVDGTCTSGLAGMPGGMAPGQGGGTNG